MVGRGLWVHAHVSKGMALHNPARFLTPHRGTLLPHRAHRSCSHHRCHRKGMIPQVRAQCAPMHGPMQRPQAPPHLFSQAVSQWYPMPHPVVLLHDPHCTRTTPLPHIPRATHDGTHSQQQHLQGKRTGPLAAAGCPLNTRWQGWEVESTRNRNQKRTKKKPTHLPPTSPCGLASANTTPNPHPFLGSETPK